MQTFKFELSGEFTAYKSARQHTKQFHKENQQLKWILSMIKQIKIRISPNPPGL